LEPSADQDEVERLIVNARCSWMNKTLVFPVPSLIRWKKPTVAWCWNVMGKLVTSVMLLFYEARFDEERLAAR